MSTKSAVKALCESVKLLSVSVSALCESVTLLSVSVSTLVDPLWAKGTGMWEKRASSPQGLEFGPVGPVGDIWNHIKWQLRIVTGSKLWKELFLNTGWGWKSYYIPITVSASSFVWLVDMIDCQTHFWLFDVKNRKQVEKPVSCN